MDIKSAEFVISNTDFKKCPESRLPEYAFIGRSNVGKSFLAFQIAEAIATGKNVLDVYSLDNHSTTTDYDLKNETEAQPIVYFDFEATDEKNYNRYSAKGQEFPYPFSSNIKMSYPVKLSFSDPSLFIDAMALETKKTGAKVIIIDNLSAISTDNEKSGNAAKLMSRIRDYQRDNKLTIIILAHTPKVYENQPLTENNLAGSANIYNLSDSVFAINTTTQGGNIRYIKQIKSKYNEKYFESENVITVKFSCNNNSGFKGFEFLNYSTEESLIKAIEKTQKDDENEEIINEVNHFGSSYLDIAKKLQPKYAQDIDIKTYRERIIKRIKALKAKGLIKDTSEAQQAKEPIKLINLIEPAQSQPIKPATTQPMKPQASQPINNETLKSLNIDLIELEEPENIKTENEIELEKLLEKLRKNQK
jgi:hypothetical protein